MQSSTLEKSPQAEKHIPPPQPWQEITGFTSADAERKMPRHERRLALRRLFKHYEKMVRDALAEHAADPDKEERTFLWDPLPTICFELGIARRKLSQLTKELTGMAAHDVIDKIRAEGVTAKLEVELAALIRRRLVPGRDYEKSTWRIFLWHEIAPLRRRPYLDPATWAVKLGFANHARLRRGCMLAHGGLTPGQLELQVLEKLGEYFELTTALSKRSRQQSPGNLIKMYELANTPIDDAWSRARRDRPEWLAAMREKLGLCDKLAPFADQTVHPVPDAETVERAKWVGVFWRGPLPPNVTGQ